MPAVGGYCNKLNLIFGTQQGDWVEYSGIIGNHRQDKKHRKEDRAILVENRMGFQRNSFPFLRLGCAEGPETKVPPTIPVDLNAFPMCNKLLAKASW